MTRTKHDHLVSLERAPKTRHGGPQLWRARCSCRWKSPDGQFEQAQQDKVNHLDLMRLRSEGKL